MNTIHDLGGMDGLTIPERDQGRILKEDWERQIWGLVLAVWPKPILGYAGSTRADIERIPPELYLTMPYYAKWLWAEEVALLRSGLVTKDELEKPDESMTRPDTGNFVPASPADVTAFLTATIHLRSSQKCCRVSRLATKPPSGTNILRVIRECPGTCEVTTVKFTNITVCIFSTMTLTKMWGNSTSILSCSRVPNSGDAGPIRMIASMQNSGTTICRTPMHEPNS